MRLCKSRIDDRHQHVPLTQQLQLHYHHLTMARIWEVMQEMAEKAMALQDEEWDCPPQTPQIPPHQTKVQDPGEESR
jgi:hypothetical protein